MAEHTGGDWIVHRQYPLCVGRYDNLAVVQARYGYDSTRGEIAGHYVKAPIGGEFPITIGYEEAKANARLIAAAPKMLTDLAAMVTEIDHIINADDIAKWIAARYGVTPESAAAAVRAAREGR